MRRPFVLCVLCLAVGVIIGRYALVVPVAPPAAPIGDAPSAADARLAELRRKFGSLSEREIDDYLRITDASARASKAEEILGKMTLILLADLGLHVSAAQERLAHAETGQAAKPDANPTPSSRVTAPIVDTSPPAVARPTWREDESRLARIDPANPGQVEGFLKRTRIEDLLGELKGVRPFLPSDSRPARLAGRFTGVISLKDGRTWQIAMETAIEPPTDGSGTPRLTGRTLIELSENGAVFSRGSGNGDMKAFHQFQGDSSAILVEASPDIYLQLYPLRDSQLIGNVYCKAGPADFKHRGTVRMSR